MTEKRRMPERHTLEVRLKWVCKWTSHRKSYVPSDRHISIGQCWNCCCQPPSYDYFSAKRREIDCYTPQISSPAQYTDKIFGTVTESSLTDNRSFRSLSSDKTGCSTSAIEHSFGPVWRTWIAELHHALESRSVGSGGGSSQAIRPLSGSMACKAAQKPS